MVSIARQPSSAHNDNSFRVSCVPKKSGRVCQCVELDRYWRSTLAVAHLLKCAREKRCSRQNCCGRVSLSARALVLLLLLWLLPTSTQPTLLLGKLAWEREWVRCDDCAKSSRWSWGAGFIVGVCGCAGLWCALSCLAHRMTLFLPCCCCCCCCCCRRRRHVVGNTSLGVWFVGRQIVQS